MKSAGFVCGFLAAFVLMDLSVQAGHWVYVSLLRERKIVCFERDKTTGTLTRAGETSCPAEPAFLNSSVDGRLLFVSFRSTGQLASYRLSAATGKLTLLNVVPGGDDPAWLQSDGTGKFLLAAYYAAGKVSVNHILPNGRFSEQPVLTLPTAPRAHGIAITSDNRTVLVPHTGANRIYVFGFDDSTGMLLTEKPPYLATPDDHEPRHIMLHPSDKWAYTSDEKGDSISVYELHGRQLELVQTVSTIPDDFDGSRNSTARCLIAPDGRSIYVANRGHNSIAAFSVNQQTGRVTSLGQTATEKIPRSFAIDASGKFLYAAGEASGRVAAYAIQANGSLEALEIFDSGPVSWAIECVDTEPR